MKSVQYNGDLAEVAAEFPEVPWTASAAGDVWILDARTGQNAPLSKGQYVVKVGHHYEIHDEEPVREQKTRKTNQSPTVSLDKKD